MLARDDDQGFSQSERAAVYRAIFTRRDVRSHFTGAPMADATLARLLSAAHRAPSVGFMQPWNFIVIRDPARRAEVRDLFASARLEEAENIAGDRRESYKRLRLEGICESTLNLCITCDRSRAADSPLGRWHNPQMDLYSTVCAVQNLWLAARAEGVGVGWVSILDEAALKRLLGLPEHVAPVAYLCLGPVSAFEPRPDLERSGWRQRLEAADLLMSETFGGDGERDLREALRAADGSTCAPD